MSNEHDHWLEKSNHTRLKHLILQYYLQNWSKILANASFNNNQEDIYYIDGFAGRGIFIDGDQGSPLIALEEIEKVQTKHNEEYSNKPLRFHIINIENEQNNFNKLEEIRLTLSTSIRIQNILGNFLEESKKILNRSSIQRSACFWFVDPFYGARDFTFNDIIELMFDPNGNKRLRKEILINFMTYNLVRFIRYDKEQPFILKFLGADSYNDIIKTASHDAKKLEETIIAYYKSKLREKGLYVVSQRIQCKDPKDPHAEHIYFHMVHCSHNERALLEMRESFVKVKEQKKVFEKELNGDQIDFFEYAGFDEIALEFSKQELVTFVKSYFMLNRPFLLRELFTLCLQEISISYYVIREMLHDLWKQGILSIKNLDNKNRRKPFNEAIKNWKFIEVTLLKEKISESNTVQEQLTLF